MTMASLHEDRYSEVVSADSSSAFSLLEGLEYVEAIVFFFTSLLLVSAMTRLTKLSPMLLFLSIL